MRQMWYFTCVTWHILHGRCQQNTQQFVFVEKPGVFWQWKGLETHFSDNGLTSQTFWHFGVIEVLKSLWNDPGWRLDWKPQEQWKTVRNVLSENDVDPERVMEVPVMGLSGQPHHVKGGFAWEGILHEWFEFRINKLKIQHISVSFTYCLPNFFLLPLVICFRQWKPLLPNMSLNPNWMKISYSRQSSWFSIYRVSVFCMKKELGPMSLSVVSKPLQRSSFVWSFDWKINRYQSGHSEWVSVESYDPLPISIDSKPFHKCLCQSFET